MGFKIVREVDIPSGLSSSIALAIDQAEQAANALRSVQDSIKTYGVISKIVRDTKRTILDASNDLQDLQKMIDRGDLR